MGEVQGRTWCKEYVFEIGWVISDKDENSQELEFPWDFYQLFLLEWKHVLCRWTDIFTCNCQFCYFPYFYQVIWQALRPFIHITKAMKSCFTSQHFYHFLMTHNRWSQPRCFCVGLVSSTVAVILFLYSFAEFLLFQCWFACFVL